MPSRLHAFWTRFDQAWNAHDAAAVASLFAEKAEFQFVDGRVFQGQARILEFYRETFSRIPQDLSHHASIAGISENPYQGHGTFHIARPGQDADVLTGNYQIELSGSASITHLALSHGDKFQSPPGARSQR